MSQLTFYWYPRCTTCKKAKAWLDENKINYTTIDMIETPPTKDVILNWMAKNTYETRRFFNTSGIKYREQGLKDQVGNFTPEEAATLLATDGMLIKRPILVSGDTIRLGFKETEFAELTK